MLSLQPINQVNHECEVTLLITRGNNWDK